MISPISAPLGLAGGLGIDRLQGSYRLLAMELDAKRVVDESVQVPDDPESARRIGLAPVDKCFIFEKLLYADGEPAIWLRDIFPLNAFVELPK